MYISSSVILIICLLLQASCILAQKSSLQGVVVDAVTNEPLIGARIAIEGSEQLGTNSDEEGKYLLKGIRQGTYTVKASYVGYRTRVEYEVRIESGVNRLDFKLEEATNDSANLVQITASAFEKNTQNIISVKSIGAEQIRSNPGGNYDISKVIQSLPGVSGSLGFRNDIIVRGGAPNENVFYLDGIEIPNLNHFATQGSGGGTQGIINANFINSVKFQSSAFGAQYDNTLSSVLDFDMISGNTERFQTIFQIGATDGGITFDTPLGKKVTALFSVRYSYLQFLFSVIQLPFLPRYLDIQSKIQYTINPKTTLTFISLGAVDRFRLNKPKPPKADATEEEINNYIDRLSIYNGLPIFEQDSYTMGLSLKRLTKKGFFTIALSRNQLTNRIFKYIDQDDSKPKQLDINSVEAENKLRFNSVNKLGAWQVNYGGVVQYAQFDNRSLILFPGIDSARTPFLVRGSSDIGFLRYGAYISGGREFFDRILKLNIGIRTDMNSFTEKGNNPLETLSPRVSVSVRLSEKLFLNTSVGTYYKLPPYTLLGFADSTGKLVNKTSRYIQSTHFVGGLEFQVNSSFIISGEGFYKLYDRYPVVNDPQRPLNGISIANTGGGFGIFGAEPTRSIGKGRVYGFEIYAQKRLTGRIYGIASYTYYVSEFSGADPNRYIRSSWDNRHLISLTGGVLMGKKRNWELAAKWRFLGPTPYTPFDIPASIAFYQIRGEAVLDFNRLNQATTASFSQIDIRLDRKWFFEKWSLNLFLDLQNLAGAVSGQTNESAPSFTLRRTPDFQSFARDNEGNLIPVLIKNYQSAFLPSVGIRAKF